MSIYIYIFHTAQNTYPQSFVIVKYHLVNYTLISYTNHKIVSSFHHTTTNVSDHDVENCNKNKTNLSIFWTIALHSIRTGTSTVHNYDTLSGLRFALYTSNDVPHTAPSTNSSPLLSPSVSEALRYIYAEIWVECVVRSPLYRPGGLRAVDDDNNGEGKVDDKKGGMSFDVGNTNFEAMLDAYLSSMPWFVDFS